MRYPQRIVSKTLGSISGLAPHCPDRNTASALRWFISTIALVMALMPGPAHALPSFAMQTGQPCAACHVGAWGPQLKKYGRDFKLFGYSAEDKSHDLPPFAFIVHGGFTHTNADQIGGAEPHIGDNNIVTQGETSFYYGGRITSESGAFIEVHYSGDSRVLALGEQDIRWAHDRDLFDEDFVYGFSFNNDPSNSDIYNSTPTWGFPYTTSPVSPHPTSLTLIDGGLAQQVEGTAAYAMWNDLIYGEFALYKGLGRDIRNAMGIVPVAGTDSVDGVAPYWRFAFQKNFDGDRQFAELGTYGISADKFPGGVNNLGSDHYLDTAVDASYQWVANTKDVTSDVISAHATYIRETIDLNASHILNGTNPHDDLSTFRADLSYAISATYTPSVQYFRNWGSHDIAFWGTQSGGPNSAGWITEINLVPWGKPDSPLNWLNGRLLLQYVAFSSFDGQTTHASDHNALFIDLAFGLAFNR